MTAGKAGEPAWRRRVVIMALLGVAILGWVWWTHSQEVRLLMADLNGPLAPGLERSALAAGEHTFKAQCAACHGPIGQGGDLVSTPNLADHDWLYGSGSAADIEQVIAYGVRSSHPKGWNLASMPGYLRPSGSYQVPALSPREIADLVAFLKAKAGRPAAADSAGRGFTLFEQKGGCYDCHGGDGQGDPAIGAPNLTDNIWLYGGSDAQISASIAQGRHGVMPAFIDRMPAARLREVALYVHSLSQAAAKEPR